MHTSLTTRTASSNVGSTSRLPSCSIKRTWQIQYLANFCAIGTRDRTSRTWSIGQPCQEAHKEQGPWRLMTKKIDQYENKNNCAEHQAHLREMTGPVLTEKAILFVLHSAAGLMTRVFMQVLFYFCNHSFVKTFFSTFLKAALYYLLTYRTSAIPNVALSELQT